MVAWKKHAALAFSLILFTFISVNSKMAFPSETVEEIDLFTQKQSCSGVGFNVSSDAFSPGEEVTIFALATYRRMPVEGLLVAFQVVGPQNPNGNIAFSRVETTNESGIAVLSFRPPSYNNISFGSWKVIGNVKIASTTAQDILAFEVGWIVEFTSLKTIDQEGGYQSEFSLQDRVGVELSVNSISMAEKPVTFSLSAFDSTGVTINSTAINDFMIQPHNITVMHQFFFIIPKTAFTGPATVRVNALTAAITEGGVPYCPEASCNFSIIIRPPPVRDIAINDMKPSTTVVDEGQLICLDVCIMNEGTEIESSNVRAYCNGALIGIEPFSDLSPGTNITVRFSLNTTNENGVYKISSAVDPIPGETDLLDNTFNGGYISVSSSEIIFHSGSLPWWFYYATLLPIALTIVLLIASQRRNRRVAMAKISFDSAWMAWYGREPLKN